MLTKERSYQELISKIQIICDHSDECQEIFSGLHDEVEQMIAKSQRFKTPYHVFIERSIKSLMLSLMASAKANSCNLIALKNEIENYNETINIVYFS